MRIYGKMGVLKEDKHNIGFDKKYKLLFMAYYIALFECIIFAIDISTLLHALIFSHNLNHCHNCIC